MIRLALLIAVLLSALASAALGSEAMPFHRGAWDLELDGGYITPIRFSDDKFSELTLSGGYYILDNISINAQVQASYADQPDKDAVLGGAGLLLRWHFLNVDRFSCFIDVGGGGTYASREVPEFGTHFNWTGKGGLGLTYRLRDNLHLIGGSRYFHLSNGNIHGREENPSYDGIQFYGGVMFTF